MMVIDTETSTDPSQRLLFGSYQFIVEGECLEEGLFYADDLPHEDRTKLETYVANQSSRSGFPPLQLLSRREFVEKLYRAVYKGRCLLVGFNLPFDLSRIAYDFTSAR